MRTLVAIPVYNEERYVEQVLRRVAAYADEILVIDDGSTDMTPCLLAKQPVEVIRHRENRGYGRALLDAFRWASVDGFDWVITMDCDEQHEPAAIPQFMDAIARNDADIISGSRYLNLHEGDDAPPPDRRRINTMITGEVNDRLGLSLTDAFCGFKAHRVSALDRLDLSESGYAFPMQLWAQCAHAGLRIREIPVRLIYNDPTRTFGGPLDDPAERLTHYRDALDQAILHAEQTHGQRTPEPRVVIARRGCGEAHAITRAHLADVEDRIARLTGLRDALRSMLACGSDTVRECRIIEVLADHGACLDERL